MRCDQKFKEAISEIQKFSLKILMPRYRTVFKYIATAYVDVEASSVGAARMNALNTPKSEWVWPIPDQKNVHFISHECMIITPPEDKPPVKPEGFTGDGY